MSKSALIWHRLRWPREVTPEQMTQVFRLLVSGGGQPIVIEAVGAPGIVEHRLAVLESFAESVAGQLRSVVPGLALEVVPERPEVTARHAVELGLTTARRSVRGEAMADVSRAVLGALTQLHEQERLTLQWLLTRPLSAVAVPNRLSLLDRESWLGALLTAPFSPPQPLDPEARQALRIKQSAPGWQVVGRIAVASGNGPRERQLVAQVLGALKSAEAPGVRFYARSIDPTRIRSARPGWRRRLRLNVLEVAALSSFPVGVTSDLPVDRLTNRLLPASKAIARSGLVLGDATYPGQARSVALRPTDSLRHLHVLGPTGTGKSTLLLNLIAQTIAAGHGTVVIDPKGDLIADTLDRISPERIGDVVLIDPSDRAEQVVGINPLASAGRTPELVADQLLSLWKSLYADSWGPRLADILGSALLTLARTPDMTIAALPALLTSPPFRRRIIARVSDPLGLGPFWATYESWSDERRTLAIAPVMNKLRPFLLRPELRQLLGQPDGFDIRRVFTERRVLLVNLSKGLLGPESAALLGSLIVSQLWQAILGRAAVPPEHRRPVLIVVDEFQDYLRLPMDFADALAQARGLGGGFVLSHQYFAQCEPAIREALLANAQSRVAFRLSAKDAHVLADKHLDAEDFENLPAFQAYARVVAENTVQPWASLATRPAPAPTSDAAAVRATSAATYGTSRAAVEAQLQALFEGRRSAAVADDLGPRRREAQP